VITYVDTSVLLKLLLDDEAGAEAADRLWLDSDFVVCAEVGYAEARAALASAHRAVRLDGEALSTAKVELHTLWAQVDVIPITSQLVLAAGDIAEVEALRGYDAVHLAAAVAAEATVVATADLQLLTAAQRRHFDVANPSSPPSR
jgi:predicted nucleic acid-binding protein